MREREAAARAARLKRLAHERLTALYEQSGRLREEAEAVANLITGDDVNGHMSFLFIS